MQGKFINLGISLGSRSSNTKGNKKGRCVTHCGLAIYIEKSILRQKKKKNYGKLKYNFTHAKNIIFQKKMSLQEIKILQDILKLYN
jgi:hypothetical protein